MFHFLRKLVILSNAKDLFALNLIRSLVFSIKSFYINFLSRKKLQKRPAQSSAVE